ncbi:hypothetical protein [Stenotrophomonas sp.]|uniref:hypothetical protein n=1 Tax=Stenotrophomonas sp. TaxID=69392 RepID=UPI0028B1443D|nr:hypothetical protein [Stenotrophomonas sp.]
MSDLAKKKREAAEVLKAKIPALADATSEIMSILDTCGKNMSTEDRGKLETLLGDAEAEIKFLSAQHAILLDDAVKDETLEAEQKALATRFEQAKKELETQIDRIKSIFEQQRKDIASAAALSAVAGVVPEQDQPFDKKIQQRRGSNPDSADQNHLQDGSQAGTGQKQKQ